MDELIPQKIILPAETYDWLVEWLDEEPIRFTPKLKKLFKEAGPFEDRMDSGQDAAGSGTT